MVNRSSESVINLWHNQNNTKHKNTVTVLWDSLHQTTNGISQYVVEYINHYIAHPRYKRHWSLLACQLCNKVKLGTRFTKYVPIVEILQKSLFLYYDFIYPIGSQMCTCHDSRADLIIIFQVKATWSFAKPWFWAHYTNIVCELGPRWTHRDSTQPDLNLVYT